MAEFFEAVSRSGPYFVSFLPSEHPVVLLLRQHGQKQAELALQGELLILDLIDCPIGDDGGEIVASFLRSNDSVIEVRLGDCRMTLRGIELIAEALKDNYTVEIVSVADNEIGDKGALAFIDVFDFNVSIKDLYLFEWNISERNIAPKFLAIVEYLAEIRNAVLIPDAARRASLLLIAARRTIADAGDLAVFPKEIVRMIAVKVWASRRDPAWIHAVSDYGGMVRQKEFVNEWMRENEGNKNKE